MIKPYLQLVRLPNVFTAAADSLAGWLLVTGSFAQPSRWVPLVAASMATYAGGIVLNDLFDLETDRIERPDRPLPSGAVTKPVAVVLALVLITLGMGLAVISRVPNAWIVEAVLIAGVAAYDAGVKRTILGPEVMGACRALNLLLGLSATPDFGGPWMWTVPFFYGSFVTGITWVSRSEVGTESRQNVRIGALVQATALSGYLLAVGTRSVLHISSERAGWWNGLGTFIMGTIVFVITRRTQAALDSGEPAAVQRAVKAGIFSLVWLHVALLISSGGPLPALAVASLWLPAVFLGRWIYST